MAIPRKKRGVVKIFQKVPTRKEEEDSKEEGESLSTEQWARSAQLLLDGKEITHLEKFFQDLWGKSKGHLRQE